MKGIITFIHSEYGGSVKLADGQTINFDRTNMFDSNMILFKNLHVDVEIIKNSDDSIKNLTIFSPYTRNDQQERFSYVLLGLFLGGLGLHDFYAGYNSNGIAKLLISIFLGWVVIGIVINFLWSLIDIITVDKSKNGIPFA